MNSAALRWRFDGDRIESKSRSLMKSTSIRSHTHTQRERGTNAVGWLIRNDDDDDDESKVRALSKLASYFLSSSFSCYIRFDLIISFLFYSQKDARAELILLAVWQTLNGLLSGLLNVSGDWDIQYSTTTDFTPWDTPFFVSQWQLIHQIIKRNV